MAKNIEIGKDDFINDFDEDSKVNAELSYNDLITLQMQQVINNINFDNIVGLKNAVEGLELLFWVYLEKNYVKDIEIINKEFELKIKTLRPDKRDLYEDTIIRNLLISKAKKLMEYARKRGITPGRVVIDG